MRANPDHDSSMHGTAILPSSETIPRRSLCLMLSRRIILFADLWTDLHPCRVFYKIDQIRCSTHSQFERGALNPSLLRFYRQSSESAKLHVYAGLFHHLCEVNPEYTSYQIDIYCEGPSTYTWRCFKISLSKGLKSSSVPRSLNVASR